MYQSSVNPNYIVPDLVKYRCMECEAEFILSEKYKDRDVYCPYCCSENAEGVAALDDPDVLGALGCAAISL